MSALPTCGGQRLHRRNRIDGDALARVQACNHFNLITNTFAHAQLAQRHPPIGQYISRIDLAPTQQRRTRLRESPLTVASA